MSLSAADSARKVPGRQCRNFSRPPGSLRSGTADRFLMNLFGYYKQRHFALKKGKLKNLKNNCRQTTKVIVA